MILLVIFLELLTIGFCQQNYGFHVVMEGNGGDRLTDIYQLHDGSGYVASGVTDLGEAGDSNIFTMKIDLEGSIIWAYSYGGEKYDFSKRNSVVQLKHNSGFIVASESTSFSSGGDKDGLIIRLDEEGSVLWSRTVSTSGVVDEQSSNVIETNDGGFLFGSVTNNTGNFDQFILKLNSDGNEEWSIKMPGSAQEYMPNLIQTKDGGYAFASTTRSYGPGGYNAVIYKFSSSGVKEWAYWYGGSDVDFGLSLTELDEGGYILSGYTRDTTDFLFLMKVTSSGDVDWSMKTGITGKSNFGYRFLQFDADTYIISGHSENTKQKFLLASIKASNGAVNWYKLLGKPNDITYGKGFDIINGTENNNGFIMGGYTYIDNGNPRYNISIIKTLPYPVICDYCEEEDVSLGSLTQTNLGYSKNVISDVFGSITLILTNVTLNVSDIKSLYNVYYYCHTCDGIFSTNTSVCNGHGNCTKMETCKCEDGYKGKYCNGCDEGYYGDHCEIWNCSNTIFNATSVCNGNGTCVGPDKCDCKDGYYSQFCEDWNCWDHHFNSKDDVCGGHGVCIAPNDCICSDPSIYLTQNCSVWRCNEGVFNNDSFICTGHGECNDHDNCTCSSSDYTGANCDYWECYSTPVSDDAGVCGGHGSCAKKDVCFCSPGYSSEYVFGPCVIWRCGVISNQDNNPKICNGRGTCIGSQQCECKNDYEGKNCETWSCANAEYDSLLTCNGHGKCLSPAECECKTGYGGDLCSSNLMYATVMAPILGTFGSIFLIIFLCILCCICGCICCCALLLVIVFFTALVLIFGQKLKMRKFSKLKNLDIILKEQELEDDTSLVHIKVNKSLFEVPYDEIKIGNILGEGGSQSVVFKAKWRGETVAFKCFKTRLVMGNQNVYDDFEKEVQILGSLNHPHIIRFFGATMKPPRVGIVMEFCSNGELMEFFGKYREENGKPYPINEKIRVIGECVNALSYCHSRSIIHRDLKCENVLVDHRENSKLMDFGLSKVVEGAGDENMTKSVGTSIYMAPEIVSSDSYDDKCDVFSFAIMFFVIVTENEKPYGKNEYRIEFKVANDRSFRPKLNELDRELKNVKSLKWIKYIIKRCWSAEPKLRLDFVQIAELFGEHLDNVDHSKVRGDGDKFIDEELSGDRVDEMENILEVEQSKNEMEELQKELEVTKMSNRDLEKQREDYKKQLEKRNQMIEDIRLRAKEMGLELEGGVQEKVKKKKKPKKKRVSQHGEEEKEYNEIN